ncbi:MAG: metal ABC transporter substrate-binding protein [candidate division WOR-3 bacterium]
MKNKKISSILLLTLINLFSCSDLKNRNTIIISTLYPISAFYQNLLDSTIVSVSVLERNMDPHISEISPSNFKRISESKIFVFLGSKIEFEEKNKNQFLKESKNSITINLSKTLTKVNDPHIWLSLDNLKIFSKVLYDTLSFYNIVEKENLNRKFYTLNSKIDSLKESIEKIIMEKQVKIIFTDHNAFYYFAQEFNLEIKTISNNEDEISVRDLKNIYEKMSKEKFKIFFYTNKSSENYAKNFEKELKAKSLYIDPLENPLTNFEKILTFLKSL